MQHGNWKCEIQSIQKKCVAREWQIGRRKVASWAKESGKSGTCSLTEETNMKYESERNTVEKCWKWKWQIGRRKVANWAKGEKQLHSRTQCTFVSFVTEKVRPHMLTIPIMCPFLHFQWKILPQTAVEEKFPCFRPFVLPTLFTRGLGNLTSCQHVPVDLRITQ